VDKEVNLYPLEPCENPASKGWTAAFVVDVALGTSDDVLCDTYELQDHELHAIKSDPGFIVQLASIEKELDKEGVSFRLKARLQAEELLATSWALIHSPATPAPVKAGLIKDTVRWAGWDAPPQEVGNGRGGFSVSIVLNGVLPQAQTQGIVIDHE
jgi:hypothetical protein